MTDWNQVLIDIQEEAMTAQNSTPQMSCALQISAYEHGKGEVWFGLERRSSMLVVLQIQFMLCLVSESMRHGSCMVCRLQTLV